MSALEASGDVITAAYSSYALIVVVDRRWDLGGSFTMQSGYGGTQPGWSELASCKTRASC